VLEDYLQGIATICRRISFYTQTGNVFSSKRFFGFDKKNKLAYLENTENTERLEFIIEGSADIFRKYGIRSISMDDIARELGISKKTLYQHVSNKTDLLRQVFDKLQADFTMQIENLLARGLNAIDELLEVSKLAHEEFKKYNPSNVFDFRKYYTEVFEQHIAIKKECTSAMLIKNMEKGISQGIYRTDLDLEVVAGLYIQKVEMMHDEKFLDQASFSMARIFEVMFEHHIRGISNEEGIAYFEKRKEQLKFE